MDDVAGASDALGVLANFLTALSVNSFDIKLHVQHLNLARSLDMEPQVVRKRLLVTLQLGMMCGYPS